MRSKLSNLGLKAVAWDGAGLANAVGVEALSWAPLLAFAAESEASTEPAYVHVKKLLVHVTREDDTGAGNFENRRVLATEILTWLDGWILEERNHSVFFQVAAACASAGAGGLEVAAVRHSVVYPIPSDQPLERTLIFLLFSEVASMVAYRAWAKEVRSGALKRALLKIQKDEAMHYLVFLGFVKRLCSLDPRLVREVRLVRISFARSLRWQSEKGKDLRPGDAQEINWWNHEVFQNACGPSAILDNILRFQADTQARIFRALEAA